MRLSLFLLIFCAIMCAAGQFPKRCITPNNIENKICCPVGSDGTVCNNGTLRGFCATHSEFDYFNQEIVPQIVANDDRVHWPNKFFERLCTCQKPFDGISCSDCIHGRTGEDCTEKLVLRKRQNALHFTAKERQKFVSILAKSKKEIDPDYVILTNLSESINATLTKAKNNAEKRKILEQSFKNENYWNVISWNHYFFSG